MRENTGRWSVTFTGATLVATLVVGGAAASSPAEPRQDGTTPTTSAAAPAAAAPDVPLTAPSAQVAPASSGSRLGARVSARWSGSVNTASMMAVDKAYKTAYAPKLDLAISWIGGSLLGCLPGLSSLSTNNATLSSLNFVRSLAGLAPVSFSPALNASAQKAALIMAANDSLSHNPSSGWRCWTSAGAKAASKSNLAIAYPSINAGQIIDLYMTDPGSNNTAVGHRRWLLNPFATVMGTGSNRTANALTVIGPTSSARPNPRWVSWPTAGYFPNTMEPNGRWSLSAGLRSVSFAKSRVFVYQNGVRIPVRRHAPHNGYAQPTLVWQLPSKIDRTGTFRVVVTRIKQAGVKRLLKTSYTVRLFQPSS